MLNKFINWATSGRPMQYIGMAFRDQVTGKMVNYYRDGYGRIWLATSRWGWDRENRRSTAND